MMDKIQSALKAKNSFLTAGSQSMTKLEPGELGSEKAPKTSFLTAKPTDSKPRQQSPSKKEQKP
jgi:hypothetical protein